MQFYPMRGLSFVFSLSAMALLGTCIASGADKAVVQHPNIVLIVADDLGYGSLGCYGSTEVKTPNIDRLAASGMRFTQFYSNPLCTPARAALMTGRYPQRCKWVPDAELSPVFREQRKNNMKQRWAWGIALDELTIPEVLKESGYRTGLIGKWHLGYDVKFHPMNYGFDEFRGYTGGNVDYHTHIDEYGLRKLDWWNGRKIQNDRGYITDLLTSYATDFITRHKDGPFFLYVAEEAPHNPLQGRDPNVKKTPLETYKEMIGTLDESVGGVVAVLHKLHLENNTLLIFCSDNGAQPPRGIAANGPLRGEKGSVQEGAIRVPCIASWPGQIAPGSECSAPTMMMDFFPTFADLAGAPVPSGREIDGIDLMPLLKGAPGDPDRVLHWLCDDSWAVRKGPWKLTGHGDKPLTLVNLDDDIGEKRNLLQEDGNRAQQLLKLHRAWIKAVGDR